MSTLPYARPGFDPARHGGVGRNRAEAFLSGLWRPVVLWHLASLDAPTVAAVWEAYLLRRESDLTHVQRLVTVTALFLAVWIVYAVDRVMDARSAGAALEQRHRFHRRHEKVFAGLASASALALGLLLPLVPEPIRNGWFLMSLPLFGYMVMVHLRPWARFPKEAAVGAVFSATVFLPLMAGGMSHAAVPGTVLFGLCCWFNCVAIRRWELRRRSDKVVGMRFFGVAYATAGFALAGTSLGPVAVPCATAVLLLLVLDGARERLGRVQLRALADAALLTPLLCWHMRPLLR